MLGSVGVAKTTAGERRVTRENGADVSGDECQRCLENG